MDNATGIDLPKEFDVATGNQIHLRMVPYANSDHPNGKQRANGRDLTFPDGRKLFMASSAPDAPDKDNK